MPEDAQHQLARIEYKRVDGRYEYGDVWISVQGQTLEEVRKHFDEILEKTDVKYNAPGLA